MPCAVVQIVLMPEIPHARKSRQFMVNPFTVVVDVLTLSPAKPAASAKVLRNATQCNAVYKPKILFSQRRWPCPASG